MKLGKRPPTGTKSFMRDGAYVTDPVLSDGAATYTPGISEKRGTTTTYLHHGLKNAEAQSQSASSNSAEVQYDAFGNQTGSTGTWNGPFGYAGGFGYQGDDTGLMLLGHRYYDSSVGRFLTPDPIKDGSNWYVYCENNPLGRADADGQTWQILKDGTWMWVPSFRGEKPTRPYPRKGETLYAFLLRVLEAGGRFDDATTSDRTKIEIEMGGGISLEDQLKKDLDWGLKHELGSPYNKSGSTQELTLSYRIRDNVRLFVKTVLYEFNGGVSTTYGVAVTVRF